MRACAGGAAPREQRVAPLAHVGRELEFGGRGGILDLGHGAVVEREGVGCARIFEVEEDAAVGPGVGDVEHLPGADAPTVAQEKLGCEDHVGRVVLAAGAGFGFVAVAVGCDLGAVDASARRLGREGRQGENERRCQDTYLFHVCVVRLSVRQRYFFFEKSQINTYLCQFGNDRTRSAVPGRPEARLRGTARMGCSVPGAGRPGAGEPAGSVS